MSSSSSSDWAAWGAGGATGGGKVATPFINGGWPTGVGAGTGEIAPANSAGGAWKSESWCKARVGAGKSERS